MLFVILSCLVVTVEKFSVYTRVTDPSASTANFIYWRMWSSTLECRPLPTSVNVSHQALKFLLVSLYSVQGGSGVVAHLPFGCLVQTAHMGGGDDEYTSLSVVNVKVRRTGTRLRMSCPCPNPFLPALVHLRRNRYTGSFKFTDGPTNRSPIPIL